MLDLAAVWKGMTSIIFLLINQEMVIVTPQGHPLEKEGEDSDCRCWTIIRLSVMTGIVGWERILKSLYKKYDVTPDIIVECPDEYSIVALVRENFGIALYAADRRSWMKTLASAFTQIEDLEIVPSDLYVLDEEMRYHLPAVERFITYMKEAGRGRN